MSPKAATATPTPCDALWASVCLSALPMGVHAQVCLVFVSVHRSVMFICDIYIYIYIYVIWLLDGGLEVSSRYYYMVMRFVYLSVSTHTLIPSPYLQIYPLCGASRVTHMLD